MPRIRTPESDEGRAQLLSKATKTAAADAAAGRRYLPATVTTEIGDFLQDQAGPPPVPGYNSKVLKLTSSRAALAREVSDSDAAEAVLETFMRDFWEVLKRRTFREKHSVAVLNYFDLPQDGTIPALSSRADRHLWAEKIAAGEAQAVAAGFPPMANPSAAEVAAKLARAETEAEQIVPKDREQELALEAVRAARPRAIELVDDVIKELGHNLRKMADGTARDIMRSYGVEYEFLPGETPDPTPAPTPIPAPAPPAGPP
jgi:hypothetical protein